MMPPTPPIWRLMSMGSNLSSGEDGGGGGKGNVLSSGFPTDVIELITMLMEGGLPNLVLFNLPNMFNAAFNQFKLESLSFQSLSLNILGTLALPSPHLGNIKRQSRNQAWIPMAG